METRTPEEIRQDLEAEEAFKKLDRKTTGKEIAAAFGVSPKLHERPRLVRHVTDADREKRSFGEGADRRLTPPGKGGGDRKWWAKRRGALAARGAAASRRERP